MKELSEAQSERNKLIRAKLLSKKQESQSRMIEIQLRAKKRIASIQHNNDECRCGSGLKFKYCCKTKKKNI